MALRKLTPDAVTDIRTSGEKLVVLAKRYGISISHACGVRSGERGMLQPRALIPPPTDAEWREAVGFNGIYHVCRDGRVWSSRVGRLLTLQTNKWGYAFISLRPTSRDQARTMFVHRLVADAFLLRPEGKCEINHIDRDKKNNSPENLEWVTKKENAAHAVAAGAYKGRKLRDYTKGGGAHFGKTRATEV